MTEPTRKIEGLTPKRPAPLARLRASERTAPEPEAPASAPAAAQVSPAKEAKTSSPRSRTARKAAPSAGKKSLSFYARTSVQDRARAAFLHTRTQEGDGSFSEMVDKALEAEVRRREELYNGGQPFPGIGGALSPGRPLQG